MKLNLANKITLLRILLVPIFLYILMQFRNERGCVWAIAIFIIASVTDGLDGFVARRFNMITTLGKFLDPLADKLLVTAALVAFVSFGWVDAWIVFIIIARELIVTSFRIVAMGSGKQLAADGLGKAKTVLQIMASVAVMLGAYPFGTLSSVVVFKDMDIIASSLMIAAAVITVMSGLNYIYKNWSCIEEQCS